MSFERLFLIAIAAAAWGTLVLQTIIDLGSGDPLPLTLWTQARYFTNLSILLTAGAYTWFAWRGWPGPSLAAGLVVWMTLTGVIYHVLLAADHHPVDWDVLVNIFQHTLLPIAVVLAWLSFAPKDDLSLRDPIYWTGWPLTYAIYALVRGLSDGKFPYFFLNPDKSGWVGVAAYIVGLGAVFFVAGFAVYRIALAMSRRGRTRLPT